MSQWHIPYDYIEKNWTESQLLMMLERLQERLERTNKEVKNNPAATASGLPADGRTTMSFKSFRQGMGIGDMS